MAGDELDDILVEKGLPAETVERINSYSYTSVMDEKQTTVIYNPDCFFREDYLDIKGSELTYLSVDLDENKVCYRDKFEQSKISYSEDDFKTSVVLDSSNIPWIVDSIDNSSHYFNAELNEFIPSYNPEIVDPVNFISKIWRETKRQARTGADFAETVR